MTATTAPAPAPQPRDLSPAVWVSATRCLTTYVLLPVLGPTIGAARMVAVPLVVCLHLLGVVVTTRPALRAAATGRWGITMLSTSLLSLNLLSLGRYLP